MPLQFSAATCIFFGIFNPNVPISSLEFFSKKGPTYGQKPPWMTENKHFDWCAKNEITSDYLIERYKTSFQL